MKRYAIYASLTLALVLAAALALTLVFRAPGDGEAIRLSAVIALVVQISMFGAVRKLASGPGGVMVGWGMGALVRFLTLVIYGILVVKVLAPSVAPAAALVGLATFLFLTTLIEPLFLGR